MSDPHRDQSPAELLESVTALRRRTRADRQAYWFPLVLFGLLTAAAAPFYVESVAPFDGKPAPADAHPLAALGGVFLDRSAALGWYWLVALVAGFLATLAWYHWRAERTGVATPTRGYVKAGAIGVAVGLLLPVVLRFVLFNMDSAISDGTRWLTMPMLGVANRGMLPHLVITVGLLVLARLERSLGLLAVALAFATAVIAVNGWFHLSEFEPGDLTRFSFLLAAVPPAAILLAGGAIAALAAKRGTSTRGLV
ncbi:hypothetical protein [Asanoa siamensis]|uniref:Uncharacterized protein n=1 Tax=Asanoa siamensis TaxID=926357 RepID=A0ABQ4CJW2_9ACTN|nr:hypothetical protein [Asanoa siamensis]GIF71258.1 hypothetical protein Asi02nite_07760 [Asanoa siamensis]